MAKVQQLKAQQLEMPQFEFVLVTPDLAKTWLRLNLVNRPVKERVLNRYTKIMSAGKWPDNHPEPLMFDTNGALLNGQHRLLAIVRSGKSIRMLVERGVDPSFAYSIDLNTPRSLRDSIIIREGGKNVAEKHVSLMARLICGAYLHNSADHPYMRDEVADIFDKYKQQIEEIAELLKTTKRGLGRASVLAAIARAWIVLKDVESRARIKEFCNALINAQYSKFDDDSAAVVLRDWLMQLGSSASGSIAYEIYIKTEWALSQFLKRIKITKLIGVTKELYRIEEDFWADK